MTVENLTPARPSALSMPRAISPEKFAFVIKWFASAVQIFGYTATSFGWTPWNIYLFLVGVFGWFAVGVLWNDRAIMLIHIVALMAMIVGLSST